MVSPNHRQANYLVFESGSVSSVQSVLENSSSHVAIHTLYTSICTSIYIYPSFDTVSFRIL